MTRAILIVEDDPPTQMLLETLVQRDGYESVTAGDGKAAIAQLASREFVAVVLDLMMPDMGGDDVIDFVARREKRVPIVVCTAAGAARTEKLDRGVVNAVVRKPFDIEELMATINRLTSS